VCLRSDTRRKSRGLEREITHLAALGVGMKEKVEESVAAGADFYQ